MHQEFQEKKTNIFTYDLDIVLQNAYKASYPPGEAREDWIILKDLANMIKKPLGCKNIKELNQSKIIYRK